MVTGELRQWIVTYDPTSDQDNEKTDEEMNQLVQSVGKLLKVRPLLTLAKYSVIDSFLLAGDSPRRRYEAGLAACPAAV